MASTPRRCYCFSARFLVLLFLALNTLPVCAQPISFRPVEVPVGFATSSFVVSDLNGDGIPDLVATYADSGQTGINRMVALLGRGDSSFVAKAINCDFGSSAPDSFLTAGIVVAAVDINGDGKPDLLATNASSGNRRTILLIGKGDGTFQPSIVIGSEILRRVADFNGDGKPDLLLYDGIQSFDVRLGNGDGTFQPPLQLGSMNFVVSLAVGDFNNDGKLDIAFVKGAFTSQGYIWIWPGIGDGTFGAAFPVGSSIGLPAAAVPLLPADFNGDGKMDLPLTIDSPLPFNTPPHGTAILFGNGDSTFRAVISPSSFGGSQGFGDFNGDGRLDVAIDSSLMVGSADGTLQPQIFFGPGHFIGDRAEEPGGIDLDFYPRVVAADLTILIKMGGAQGLEPRTRASVAGWNAAARVVSARESAYHSLGMPE